jgi:hypothetical protein
VYCDNMRHAHIPIQVKLPNGTRLQSSAAADLAINSFNPRACSAHIIHGLASHSLLSCGQMCDAGYKVLFDEGTAQIINGNVAVNGNVVMQGEHNRTTGLWTVPLDATEKTGESENKRERNEIKNVYEISKVYDTIQYLHAAAGSPVKSRFIKAIEAGNFTTWPTLMAQHVKKYLEKTEATVKGRLNQTRTNVRITRPKTHNVSEDATNEFETHITKCTNVVHAAIHAIESQTYTDLMGRFPTTSSRGYKATATYHSTASTAATGQQAKSSKGSKATEHGSKRQKN